MARRRFIADTFTADEAILSGDQAAHLARVLRAAPGQIVDVVAGGFLHRAEIVEVTAAAGSERVRLILHEELETETALPLRLILAVFKFDHLEWGIEKTTELGVARITPVIARRTEKHLALAASKRVERWRRIALEASKQSRRVSVPSVEEPVSLKAALASENSRHRILLSEVEQSAPLSAAISSYQDGGVCLAIGPEGGWTAEELQLFSDHAWQPVTLGPRILRAETAAIAATAIITATLNTHTPGTTERETIPTKDSGPIA